jgi:hypothetical protein
MKQLFLVLTVLSCGIATATPHRHGPKHLPHNAKICRECDGDGEVRSWKKAWFGKRQCRTCDGRGYFMLPPPAPKPAPRHAHKGAPVHGKKSPFAPKPAPVKKHKRP